MLRTTVLRRSGMQTLAGRFTLKPRQKSSGFGNVFKPWSNYPMLEKDLLEAGAVAHERFVREQAELDLAWQAGRLDEWLQEKLANERRAAGFEPAAGDA